MTRARAEAARPDRAIAELPARQTPGEPPGDSPARAPRGARWRWIALAALGSGVVALFAWSPGGGETRGGPGFGGGSRAATVSAAVVERGSLQERATYPGELAADAADLASKIGGRLLAINVRTGDEVQVGQVLARIDTSDLRVQKNEAAAQVEAATAAERRARVELEAAERELERSSQLHERQVISGQEVDGLRDRVATLKQSVQGAAADRSRAAARVDVLAQQIREAVITAPFAGTVTERYADAGAFVQAGSRVVRLVSGGPLRVRFEVPERDVGGFGKGANFQVRAPPTGARTLSGTVTGAAREVDRQRRVAQVEGVVDEAPESWLSGMYAEVVTPKKAIEDALVVPERAVVSRLQPDGEVDYGVFRPDDGVARWVSVQVLGREDDRAAVEGAVSEGDRLLVGGHRDLGDGAPISIAGDRDGESEA